MDIVIGCPIYEREWILDSWFNCLSKQKLNLKKEVTLIFGYTEGKDGTINKIIEFKNFFKDIVIVDCNDVVPFGNRNPERFHSLVEIRNRMLEAVREIEPDYYFSYDSDIVLQNDAVKRLIKNEVDVVAPWMDIIPPSKTPNCATRVPNSKGKDDGFKRFKPFTTYYPNEGIYKVDAAFAVVLMSPKAYAVDYRWHVGGEDYGWALNLADAGIESWIDATMEAFHIYNKIA